MRPWLALVGGMLLASLIGCTPAARHEMLTFFFTGVPPLGAEEQEEQTRQSQEGVGNQELTRMVQAKLLLQRRTVPAGRYTHGPYASNQCNLCHETSASGGFRGFGKQQDAKTAEAGAVSGKLVAPMGELCAGCHASKSVKAAFAAGLWVHGPVSTGYCVLCHGPHAGPEPYMLLKKADALCLECHTEGLVFNRAEHKEMRDCLKCHNPHLGKDSRLLKAEYRESW